MNGMRITVEERGCLRYGLCVAEAPEVFALDDDDEIARVLVDPVPDHLVDQAEAGVDLCPMQALSIVDD
jgi:ferredoxin